jgi:sugar lactone lactonase YvrE
MRIVKTILAPAVLLVVVLVCMGTWVAADGPVAKFPSFTPFGVVSAEGVAVDKIGNVYVSVDDIDGRGKIWRFTPRGERSVFADVAAGAVGGLAVDAKGDVYIAISGGIEQGVYRVDRNGNPHLVPGTEQIAFADGLAFDERGNLYVTEANLVTSTDPLEYGQGGIWRVPPKGVAELWLRDDLLTGTGAVLGYPVGANGIAYYLGDLFVISTDQGTVVRVPVRRDGSPGQPEIWATLEDVPGSWTVGVLPPLGDGLALDVHGNVYVAVVTQHAIVRINRTDKSQETVAAFSFNPQDPLFASFDTPTSLAFGTGKGGRESLFVANLGWFKLVYGYPTPGPGLVKIEAGVPGLPLQ